MTSNQLAYWRLNEEERSNKAKETETARHNVEDESISKFRNDLTKLGLDQERIKNILELQDQWSKYGSISVNQLPDDVRKELYDALGFDTKYNEMGFQLDSDEQSVGNALWDELRRFWNNSQKTISSLF